jgi:hypothetical protein
MIDADIFNLREPAYVEMEKMSVMIVAGDSECEYDDEDSS